MEECGADKVVIVSSARFSDQVSYIAKVLGSCLRGGVAVESISDLPGAVDPVSIKSIVDRLRKFRPSDRVYFVSSAGSRLEVSVYSMALRRDMVDVIYIHFYWGPWTGGFYPFTPKPLQPIYIIHPGAGYSCKSDTEPRISLDCLEKLLNLATGGRLRKTVYRAQLALNKEIRGDRCCYEADLERCSCKPMRITMRMPRAGGNIEVEVDDYCSPNKVVEAIDELWRLFRNACPHGERNRYCELGELILRASGVVQPVVGDVESLGNRGLEGIARGRAISDALNSVERDIVIDTNIVYSGIHNQLYESERLRERIVIPNCLLAEMYRHQLEGKAGVDRVKGELSNLLVNEIKDSFKPRILYQANTLPCEVGVGMALAGRSDHVFATADVLAYERIPEEFGVPAVRIDVEPVSRVEFGRDEGMRRVSYSYYALAQYRALSRELSGVIGKHAGDFSFNAVFV